VGKGQHDKQFFSSPHLHSRSLGLGAVPKPMPQLHIVLLPSGTTKPIVGKRNPLGVYARSQMS